MDEERLSFTEREGETKREKRKKERNREWMLMKAKEEEQTEYALMMITDLEKRKKGMREKRTIGNCLPFLLPFSLCLFLPLSLLSFHFFSPLSTSSFLQTIVFSFQEPSSFYAPRDSSCLLHSVLSINREKRERRREEEEREKKEKYFFHWPLT